ncbi:hypothetical protein ELI55_36865 [Rhizobium ruizarguesonis]|uniref:sacsin N-terminal ATP-binding-like domain-containing protein n=1 Tax=Rhizobium ruizarguesonis TaxID=2081791 RepID=UPI00102F5A28|nr:hypothetical protein [Rhizobium ruizarguesonis]TAT91977.1 hypothetical protein ELI55_36865 [Rhizobium ruizarguesonis]TAZ26630.1 hypothetical protein ELH74_31835 [Rhizobium ruizarguesonis]TCA72220.1 hypothetical protein E0H62_20065 [Rhizobium leguminosarum bv. viciae]
MNAFLHSLMEQRRKFLDGLDANENDINLDIFEDFYPDHAHFVFELLQNAEDTGATEASFKLTQDGCWFEHNGLRTFTESDVRAITGIHNSTKTKSSDQIGKFGVGFKSVFVYTQTPTIYAADFSFKIVKYVMPEPVGHDVGNDARTRFWLPFNNPKKTPDVAYSEIAAGFNELAETTLLFLPNIESIKWQISDTVSGEILRIAHTPNHVEVLKQNNGKTTTSAHFLKFDQPVKGFEKQRVAIAFALDILPNVKALSADKALSQQLKVIPASGQVCVFFPASKETSGLRFHLHAPFVPELSRASIKDTPANNPLYDQLAALSASALQEIRDLGLLTTDFLGVLPNAQDQLGKGYGYELIRDAITEAMKTEPLFPTHGKGHSPANRLVQAKASLKDLLTEDDIEYLIECEGERPLWAASRALQGTNVERFMTGLEIRNWDIDAFVECLGDKASEGNWGGVDNEFMAWLGRKSVEWHQQFYSLLDRESEARDEIYLLKRCRIVRLTDNNYAIGAACHFSETLDPQTDSVRCVDPAVYTAGKSKAQQESARRFLESAGVTPVGERQLVEAVLKGKYVGKNRTLNERAYLADLRRFMKFLDEDVSAISVLAAYPIFVGKNNEWRKAADIYLDAPYLDTGLGAYLELGGASARPSPLADFYQSLKIDTVKITRFAEKLGARTTLAIAKASCRKNPQWNYLCAVAGERFTNPIDRDFIINHFSALAAQKSEALARLVWRTMCALGDTNYGYDSTYHQNPLRAVYRKNERGGAHFADSQLVYQLRQAAWVPQKGGEFVKPGFARSELLPDGFTFDAGWPWIKAIQFGRNIELQSQKVEAEAAAVIERQRRDQEAAKSLGFVNAETARKFAAMPVEEQQRALAEYERRTSVALPDHEPSNPTRRRERIVAHSSAAPVRKTEERTRSVSVGRDEVKDEAKQYLRQQYTNADAEQICQACKDVLPFRLNDGSFYFETVELLPELKRHYDQNYLCLCPNHAAMFKHANSSRDTLLQQIGAQTENELSIILAERDHALYFTKTHLADLRTIIEVDQNSSGSADLLLDETS